ncbi:MAG: caspase family protein [Planctomycetes bacterium]|nr:caspase family protein [Planctomycetota bacterium]
MRRALPVAGALAALALAVAPARAQAPRLRALLVGVSEYPLLERALGPERYRRLVRLEGPRHDVALLRDVLVARLGASPGDVETLAAEPDDPVRSPTRRNLLRALTRLARAAAAGDTVLVALSGHGTQEKDASGDEADGLDEVFLAADARTADRGDGRLEGGVSDDELGAALGEVARTGARVVLVADCCHAGTLARGGDGSLRGRGLDPALLAAPGASGADGERAGPASDAGDAPPAGVTALYAARAGEKAGEMRLPLGASDAVPRGLLTWALAQELSRSRGRAPWREVAARVAATLASLGVHGAHPFADGDVGASFLPAAAAATDVAAWRRDDGVVLDAGALEGFVVGAVVALAPARAGDPTSPRRATVVAADALRARARLDEAASAPRVPAPEDGPAWRATLVASPAPPPTLTVARVQRDGTPGRAPGLPRADDGALRSVQAARPGDADWLLVEDGERAWLRPARLASQDVTPLPVDAASLDATLAQVARVERLVRLAASGLVPAPAGLAVEAMHDPRPAGAAAPRPLEDGARVRPGDALRFVARNGGATPLDVWAFVLDGAAGVTCVFPGPARSPRVAPGEAAVLVEADVTDDTTGEEHLLVVASPAREGALPSDLRWLEAPPLRRSEAERARGAAAGTLGTLLASAAFGDDPPPPLARGAGAPDLGGLALRTWTTSWEPIVAPSPPSDGAEVDVGPGRGADGSADPFVPRGRCRLARSAASRGGYDVLVAQDGDGPLRETCTFVAADDVVPAGGATEEAVRRLAAPGAFPAAVAVRATGRRVVAVRYARTRPGDLDVERDADGETRTRDGDAWTWSLPDARVRLATLDPARWSETQRARLLAALRGLLVP